MSFSLYFRFEKIDSLTRKRLFSLFLHCIYRLTRGYFVEPNEMIKRDEDVVFRIQTKSAPRWQGLMTKVVGVIEEMVERERHADKVFV